jgi:hypothetical protein
MKRPLGVTLLAAGLAIAGLAVAGLHLLLLLVVVRIARMSGGVRLRDVFDALQIGLPVFFFLFGVALVASAVGLWRRRNWGRRLALGLTGASLAYWSVAAFAALAPGGEPGTVALLFVYVPFVFFKGIGTAKSLAVLAALALVHGGILFYLTRAAVREAFEAR